jgi:hypothetical protein
LRLRDLIFAGEIGEQQAIGFEQHAHSRKHRAPIYWVLLDDEIPSFC